jgi:hypothetical protein
MPVRHEFKDCSGGILPPFIRSGGILPPKNRTMNIVRHRDILPDYLSPLSNPTEKPDPMMEEQSQIPLHLR